ncbi:hypothetical protein DWX75_04325 [Mitsuokella sp. AF21-1AC]|nr:hypothetical protein DWX75_04325 [Mitsuokella sp. AF21-1AC]
MLKTPFQIASLPPASSRGSLAHAFLFIGPLMGSASICFYRIIKAMFKGNRLILSKYNAKGTEKPA